MTDQGLNLRQASRADLHSGDQRGLGLVRRNHNWIVTAWLISGDLAAALDAGCCTGLLARAAGLPAPQHLGVAVLLAVFAFFVTGLYNGRRPEPYQRFRQRALGVGIVVAVWSLVTVAHRGGESIAHVIFIQTAYAGCLLVISHYVEVALRTLLIDFGLWNAPTILVGPVSQYRDAARYSRQNWLLKRMLDLVLAVPLALLALPVVTLAAILTKLIDPGPAFFAQERIGYGGKLVKMHKLRTMYADSSRLLEEHLNRDPHARAEWQQFFKLRNDPRILPIIGNFLRRSSIDELPQLWNVIRGDMSLVGPRPLPAYHIEQLDEEFQSLRSTVLPGLTGLWQVSSRSDGDLQVLREQDLSYIRNSSFWLDVFIMLQTLPAVLAAKGAR
ncbi:sugar transferase [Bradyrhizobium viridifuturi]|uniref:sugar transferase n=1 Tax=Bradyrhizobium viridifuturi TaxID=1654716 RepID=UPI00067F1F8B|nr:sugar transferase [Bradyrhizobium viridifuturi]